MLHTINIRADARVNGGDVEQQRLVLAWGIVAEELFSYAFKVHSVVH